MPRVSHRVEDRNKINKAMIGRPTGGASHAGVTHYIQGKTSNLFSILEFIKKGPTTAQKIGEFLGVSHKDQAITRGSQRLKGLIADGLVSRGAQEVVNSRESHALYSITEKGKSVLEAGHVKA